LFHTGAQLHRRFDRHFYFSTVGSSDATQKRGSYFSYSSAASLFLSNPNLPSAAGRARRRLPARLRRPPRVARAPCLLHRPLRARRRPPCLSTAPNRAPPPPSHLARVCPRRGIWPCATTAARRRPQGGAQGPFSPTTAALVDPLCCGEHKLELPCSSLKLHSS
jgi:hypothetical protein